MFAYRHALLGLAGALLASTAQAGSSGATLIPVIPFPGSTSTTVFGIADDDNSVAGSYVDADGFTHGFYGTLDGNYTSFDFGDSQQGTQARAIANNGSITGFSNTTADHCSLVEWERKPDGSIAQITDHGVPQNGIAQGYDSKTHNFAADRCEGDGTITGFVGHNGKYKTAVTTPFESPYTGERGMNKDGTVVGFYVDSQTQLQVGTIIQGGTTTTVSYPDASQSYTVMEGINNHGVSTGQWGDFDAIVHAFTLDGDTYTSIEVPGAESFTQAWGINKHGLVAVGSDVGGFIFCPRKPSKCPTGGTAIKVNTIKVSPGKRLSYGDVKHGAAPAKYVPHKLPKGAAPQ